MRESTLLKRIFYDCAKQLKSEKLKNRCRSLIEDKNLNIVITKKSRNFLEEDFSYLNSSLEKIKTFENNKIMKTGKINV